MAAVLVTRRFRLPSVPVTRRFPRSSETVLKTLAVALLYYVSGRLGLLGGLTVESATVTPIWPPTGVAVAALLVYGLSVWPGIAVGSFLVIASLTTPQPATLVTMAGNTLAPICACLMLRAVGFRPGVSRVRDGLALVFLGGLGAMLLSATTGVGVQVVTGSLRTADFWSVWLAWWVGDAMGVLLVTPLLLVLMGAAGPLKLKRWKEMVCLGIAAVIIVPLAVLGEMSLLFLVFPLLIWAALRFQLAGSMVCALFASVLTTFEANTQHGAFVGLSPNEIMVKLQAFNGAAALTALLLSAMVADQRATRRSVQSACRELAEVLEHLAAGESPPDLPAGQAPSPSASPRGAIRGEPPTDGDPKLTPP
ncbi:MASE1 domain-containing protein [Streptomyces sp. NPDC091272]|uniref:MASE1 domain-containing protein n=1 Tax=Streptomyces sp. NPDC091272 TaxID=3365981 RepID=UPI00381F55E9